MTVFERDVQIDELELEFETEAPILQLDNAISIEGVGIEEEIKFIKHHFCSESGEFPVFVLVEDEYFELGCMDATFERMLSLASVGAGYHVNLHIDGVRISMTEPENLIRLINL